MSWGLSPWGLSPFGLGGSFVLVSAEALADRVVRVVVSAPPLVSSAAAAGSATNPATWSVYRTDDGSFFTVIDVDQVSATVFDLALLQVLGPGYVEHVVASSTLVSIGGSPLGEPDEASFLGLLAIEDGRPADANVRDLANPQENAPGGTLRVGSDGDYENDSGVAFLRKLIVRRLTTLEGEFFHLQNYGQGLSLKEPLPVSDLVKLRAQLELALSREPEIRDLRTRVALSSDGALLVTVRAVVATTGTSLTVGVEAPLIL